MGKGDMKTKRGKIYRGTHGKRRPKKKNKKIIATANPKPAAVAKKPAVKKVAKPKAKAKE